MADEKVYIADKSTLDLISNNLGSSADAVNQTSGSLHAKLRWTNTQIGASSDSSDSTMYGKLNSLSSTVSNIYSNTGSLMNRVGASSDTSNSNGSVHGKLKYLEDRIGTTSDTGGSSSAGTVNAKLNSLISTLSTVNTNASNASSYASQANTNASNASSYSNTAKTQIGSSSDSASQTGTSLQSKTKYIANTVASINTTVNNMVSTLSSISNSIANISSGGIRRIQSGVCSVRNSNGNISKDYSLTGFTNASKMVAFVIPVMGKIGTYDGGNSEQAVALTGPSSLSTTTLSLRVECFGSKIPTHGRTWIQGYYTVIEFN